MLNQNSNLNTIFRDCVSNELYRFTSLCHSKINLPGAKGKVRRAVKSDSVVGTHNGVPKKVMSG